MKVHYISDIHLDFHISEKLSFKSSQKMTEILNFMFDISEESCYSKDIAIIGGDLSHSEWQIKFLFKHLTNYFAKVIVVLGNHDYYLTSNSKVNKYHNNSNNRKKAIENIAKLYDVVILDRTVYEYKGLTIAGATMWYPLETRSEKLYFDALSNDSRLIRGYSISKESKLDREFFEELFHSHGDKINIFVSHVPIVNTQKNIELGSDCYYCPVEWLPNLVLQGHTHEISDFEKCGSKIIMNGMGYNDLIKAKVFEVKC